MLTFFRRIRKGLISAGQGSKDPSSHIERPVERYLLYAIGEILLVMIGILLALQVNNWNEQRNEDKFELKMLEELSSSLQSNIDYLDRGIEMTTNARNSSLVLLNHFEQKRPYHDSLDIHFMYSLFWYKSIVDFSAFETIKTYGLHLITNDQIRKLLSFVFEGRVQWVETVEQRNHDFYFQNISGILLELFEGTEFSLTGSMKPRNYETLSRNFTYLNILKTLSKSRDMDIVWYQELRGQMLELHELVEGDLRKNH
jgi:hypothetical protein